jgi:hypothetical protein
LLQVFVADVTDDARADAVAVDAGGNVFVAARRRPGR